MNSRLNQPQRFEAFIHQCVTAALKQIEGMDANHLILAGHSEKTGSLASLDEHIQCMLMICMLQYITLCKPFSMTVVGATS
jgi:hypothetical protein